MAAAVQGAREVLGAARVRQLPGGGLAGLLRDGVPPGTVNLAVGTPAFPDTPPELVDAACAALRAGVHQYQDPAGVPALRERIAAGLPTAPDPDTEITVTVGGSEGLCVALLAAVDPGDEVIVLEPCYENFLSAVALAGGRVRPVPLRAPDWSLVPAELAAAMGPRTRAIILNSPGNPTGQLLGHQDLAVIAELCERWDVTVVSDEVYADYVYDGRQHCSAAEVPGLAERSIVVGSFSKSHAISGWRLGFLRAPARWTELLRQIHVATTAGAPAAFQHAAAAVDLHGPGRQQRSAAMAARRDSAVALLRDAGFHCAAPAGGCYVLAGIDGLTDEPSPAFVRTLLQESGVLLAPATSFFADPRRGERQVRVAFNRPAETLDTARRHLLARTRAGLPHRIQEGERT
ncbi:pyridoxal phosphate-dependent aminotransferase [Streptomyces sp. WAC 06783]|uniref:pyridoxal phosphate-dependent aminotransferase n=1 Tax=Streptomyces sp. WAC 06783 TaxID=2203211 RepID=UPI000F735E3F|nr:pyridoxal phosphate-dependent aminotransferase [Streptomyces sp. WAC 06783]RSO06592.1 pyridoxal phosphate-dependent aminotransferase [Streptomyces sp. WAC 06783]